MAYRNECSECGRTFQDGDMEGLMKKVEQHGERQHDTEVEREDIEKKVETV